MTNDPAPVFLDANVLARPVTRTLLLTGADAFNVAPAELTHPEPSVMARAVRCILCESIAENPSDLRTGLCIDCTLGTDRS
jgi:formylmethanofuran dehydrogenase subunit E